MLVHVPCMAAFGAQMSRQNKTAETATKHMHVVAAWASTGESTELVPKRDKLSSW